MAIQTGVVLSNAYVSSGVTQGVLLENSKTLTDISPGGKIAGAAFAIAGGSLAPGTLIRFNAKGEFSTKSVTEEEILIGLYYGGVGGKALAKTKIKTVVSIKEQGFELLATSRILALPAAATEANLKEVEVLTQGHVIGLGAKVSVSASPLVSGLPLNAPKKAVQAGETEVEGGLQKIDATKTELLTLGWKFPVESTENKVQCLQWLVEVLN